MNEFLNPKSMVTPGVAGAMVMLIANAVVSQFPEVPFRWAITLLSFMVGTVVFYAVSMPLLQRVAFWGVNSLIIFSVGIGTSNVAANVQKVAGSGPMVGILDSLVPSAHAQTPAAGIPTCEEHLAKTRQELAASQRQVSALTQQLAIARRTATSSDGKAGFFNRW